MRVEETAVKNKSLVRIKTVEFVETKNIWQNILKNYDKNLYDN